MAERTTFGKRGTFGDSTLTPAPVAGETVRLPNLEVSKLHEKSGMLRSIGELVGFGGVLLMFAAGMTLPGNPAMLTSLARRIFVPPLLVHQIDSIRTLSSSDPVEMLQSAGTTPVMAILLLGILAVSRRRWVLGALCAGFFCVPWPLFGYTMPLAPFALAAMGIVAAFRLLRLPGWAGFALVAATLWYGHGALDIGLRVFAHALSGGSNPVIYQAVSYDDLIHAGDQPGIASTFAKIETNGPQEAAAKAFVMAQDFALAGDAAGTSRALGEARAGGFPLNPFDARLMRVLQNYASDAGALGVEAQQTLRDANARTNAIWWPAMVLGILLAVIGPFVDVLSGRVLKRATRIEVARTQLEGAREAGSSSSSSFGRRSPGGIQSVAASEGEAIITAISRRLGFYLIGGGAVFLLGLLGIAGYFVFWLPPADSNSAFGGVMLFEEVQELLVPHAFTPRIPPFLWLLPQLVTGGSIAILAAAWIFRRFAPYYLGGIALVYVLWLVAGLGFVRHEGIELAPAQISPGMRTYLLGGIDAPATRGAGINTFDSIKPILRPVAPAGVAPAPTLVAPALPGDPPRIEGSLAAFTLAEIAYVENRPQDIVDFLNHITHPEILTSTALQQRIALMREWAVSNGLTLSPSVRAPETPASMALVRNLAPLLLVAGLVGMTLALVFGAAFFIGNGRRRRIAALIVERQAYQGT